MSQAGSAQAQALPGPRLAFDVLDQLLRCLQTPQPPRGEHSGGALVVLAIHKEFGNAQNSFPICGSLK